MGGAHPVSAKHGRTIGVAAETREGQIADT
jgi:hypothetical protein